MLNNCNIGNYSSPAQSKYLEYRLNNNYPIEEYLNDECAIPCTKVMSDTTKKYFNSNNIKKLILLITEEPKDDDFLRGHKLPYIANEILKLDCPYILQRFILSKKDYYNEYKDILEDQEELSNKYNTDTDSEEEEEESEKENDNIDNKEEKNDKINNNDNDEKLTEDKCLDINNDEISGNNNDNNKKLENNNMIEKNINNKGNNNEDMSEDKILDNNEKEKENKNNNINKENKQKIEIKENNKKMEETNSNIDIDEIKSEKNIEKKELKVDEIDIKKDNKKIENEEINININNIKEKEDKKQNENINNNKDSPINELNNDMTLKKENSKNNDDIINKEINKTDNEIIKEKEKKDNNMNNKNENSFNDSLDFKIKDLEESESIDNEDDNNEYLDLLLNFIMNDKQELNYVLSGYFSNVINNLLEKYPSQLLNYFYTIRKDALKRIAFRSYQRSFSLISSKLLCIENNNKFKQSNDSIEKHIKFRNEIIGDIIKSINLDGFKDERGNIYNNIDLDEIIFFINKIINDTKVLDYIVEKNDIYGHIFNILDKYLYDEQNFDDNFENKYFMYKLLIKFFTKLIQTSSEQFKNPKKFSDDSMIKEKSKLSFNEYAIITFGNILKNNYVPKKPAIVIGAGSSIRYEGLGNLNIKILYLVKEMCNFMKEIPNIYDSILIKNLFCQRSFDYFFKYYWNNIYHFSFVEFFIIYLNEESKHPELTKFFFKEYKLHEVLIDYLKKNTDKQNLYFKFKTGYKIKTGIYPHILHLAYYLQVIGGLTTFSDEEKTTLKIENLGEFQFLKNENTKNCTQQKKTSSNISDILKQSKEWNEIIDTIVIPLIRAYEGKLSKEEEKKKEDVSKPFYETDNRNSNNNDSQIDLLLNFINRERKGKNALNEKNLNKMRKKLIMGEMKRNKRRKIYRDIEEENNDDNNNQNNKEKNDNINNDNNKVKNIDNNNDNNKEKNDNNNKEKNNNINNDNNKEKNDNINNDNNKEKMIILIMIIIKKKLRIVMIIQLIIIRKKI